MKEIEQESMNEDLSSQYEINASSQVTENELAIDIA
jgi:hypothetical protein